MSTAETEADAVVPEVPALNDYQREGIAEQRQLDRWLLTLSGGALALSLTFLKEIAGPSPECKILLGLSWFALAVAVLITLWSMRQSVTAWTAVDDAHDPAGSLGRQERAESRANDAISAVETTNTIAIAAFVVGVGLLCTFAFENLGSREVQDGGTETKQEAK